MAINRVTIMGNLTRDAELRKKGDATSVLTFGLAINEKKKDSETGEYVDAPVFVDCALFGEPKHLLPISPRERRFRWMDGSATTLG